MLKVKRSDAVSLLSNFFPAATVEKMTDQKLAAKLNTLPEGKSAAEEDEDILNEVYEAKEKDVTITVVPDKAAGKPQPKGGKPAAAKPKPGKKKPEPEEEEEDEDEEDQDLDEDEEDPEVEEDDDDADADEDGDEDAESEEDDSDDDGEYDLTEDEDEESEDEDSEEDEPSDEDEDESDEETTDEEDEEMEATAKKPASKKPQGKPAGKNNGKPAGKPQGKGTPIKKAGGDGKPGVIASIAEFLTAASPNKPLPKEKICNMLGKRFGRSPDEFKSTVAQQVPGKLRGEKGLNVQKNEGGYWIAAGKAKK